MLRLIGYLVSTVLVFIAGLVIGWDQNEKSAQKNANGLDAAHDWNAGSPYEPYVGPEDAP